MHSIDAFRLFNVPNQDSSFVFLGLRTGIQVARTWTGPLARVSKSLSGHRPIVTSK